MNVSLLMNNLSGEGLFDERPTTQLSLGRFVLQAPTAHATFVSDSVTAAGRPQTIKPDS